MQYAALGAGDRPGTAGLGRAELDRAPPAGRARVPPRAARGGERPGARRRRRPRSRARCRTVPAPVVVDVAALTHRIGLDAVGRALFSADLSGHAEELLDATSDAAELVVRLGRSILPTPSGRRRRPTSGSGHAAAARRRHVARCRGPARPAAGTRGVPHGDDLLGLLLDSGLTTARSATSWSPWSSPATRPSPRRSPGP